MKISPQKLSIAMARAEVNFIALAKASGVSRATLSYINSGKSCRPDIAGKIANALKVPLENLVTLTESQHPA